MKRETANFFRSLLEDWIPPALRDSPAFRIAATAAWSDYIDKFFRFRQRASFLTEAEYDELYKNYPRVLDESDNSEACIQRIVSDASGPRVCDVGCGGGFLLKQIQRRRNDVASLTGVDLALDKAGMHDGIDFVNAKIEALPFPDGAFDTVICTHVVEHVLDCRAAIAELRRVAARRLIIVVPREREYKYTFNPHLHFFPYTYSFLRVMHPVPATHKCVEIGRDIYYSEDL
jgi:2-polyprenyl-3-methyl-5-hydroxy-6-metoxy-1,4-benzoquinol methylase